jgi:hypothetical protein
MVAPRLILNAVAELEKLGVRVRSMTEVFDTGTSTGRLMLTMLSGFASHEREVIRERSAAGALRVAQAGADRDTSPDIPTTTDLIIRLLQSESTERGDPALGELQQVLAQGEDLTHAARCAKLADDLNVQGQDLQAQVQRAKEQVAGYGRLTTNLLAALTKTNEPTE